MRYTCCYELRRNIVEKHPTMNGIDFLEVLDDPDLSVEQRQRTLFVYFIKSLSNGSLIKENIHIEGGEQIRDVKAIDLTFGTGSKDNILEIRLDKAGDFSNYTFHLVPDNIDTHRLDQFDPILRLVDFSFKVNCPSDFDCQTTSICLSQPQPQPEINYLVKDYASFRQLMLDRIAVLMPDWKEQNAADVGITLVEMLAYIADYLSYQQDAVATEAYLGTARRRISVRRHARLVEYYMHDGCNARVLIQIQVNKDIVQLDKRTPLLTHVEGQETRIPQNSQVYDQVMSQNPVVFETMHPATLFKEHNEMCFYTWGARECCLPGGATRATLLNHYPNLKAGDILIFVEELGPKTGEPQDANFSHRHAVHLNHVILKQDPLGGKFKEPPDDNPVDVTEIQWAPEDALPFPLCISAKTDENEYIDKVNKVLGNIILADHGLTIEKPEDPNLDEVPKPKLFRTLQSTDDHCQEPTIEPVFPRFHPHLGKRPLTFSTPFEKHLFGIIFSLRYQEYLDNKKFDELKHLFENHGIKFTNTPSIRGSEKEWSISDGIRTYLARKEEENDGEKLNFYELPASAHKLMQVAHVNALPSINLESELDGTILLWTPKRDLIGSRDKPEFVVEVENDGTAYLRFGDDQYGLRPKPGTKFFATYRIGNGAQGNVGAETLRHIISDDPAIEGVSNPLPAQGGAEPESMEHVRQSAPHAFRAEKKRAVIPEDYAAVAELHQQVQQAAATLRWTGSWYTVFLAIDRLGGLPIDRDFKKEIRTHINRYRMAGHDVEIDSPRFVPLEIEMLCKAKPGYFYSDVKAALLQVFSNRVLADGKQGVFHPDNFSFGQTVYLSKLYAVAQAVEGVDSMQITRFQRQGIESNKALKSGKLAIGRLEIARLYNDPNLPKNGVFMIREVGK